MNPWLIIALMVAWAVSLVGAERFGESRKEDAMVAAQKVAQDAAIKQHNEDAAVDMSAAAEAERARVLADAAARERSLELQKGKVNGQLVQSQADAKQLQAALNAAKTDAERARLVAAGGCMLSDVAFRLLNADIAAYNASAATSGKRVDAMPSNALTAEQGSKQLR